MSTKKRIFISPLDWGLGHATRCIPIIRELKSQGAEVVIGADRNTYHLLKQEFPEEEFIRFPGYEIEYPKYGKMLIKMATLSPKILSRIQIEHEYLKEIVRTHQIDGIISDNRFGLYHDVVPSIFITHQLFIKSPLGEKVIERINKYFIKKYTHCWVPDYPEKHDSLSGSLSHKKHFHNNVTYIGPLSRFNNSNKEDLKYDLMAIISGPEPQRQIFESKLLNQLKSLDLKTLVVLGQPQYNNIESDGNITIYSHMSSSELEVAIKQSNIIISRSGYSTIMDLDQLEKKAIFIPTPGQTEQEYLAKYHEKKGHCIWEKQKNFEVKHLWKSAKNIDGFKPIGSNILEENLKNFLKRL